MAKNKNKGFSLIEIVVAIAILTLLLTPVVSQFTQTMKTNRKAKEQQKAVENANYVLEYFQKTSMSDTTTLMDSTKEAFCETGDGYGNAYVKTPQVCQIYEYDSTGDKIDPVPVATINYSAYKYSLNSKEVYGDVEYSRTVVLDDLSNKLMETEVGVDKDTYRVMYSFTKPYDDFELTNEGSLVKYDANGYVNAIVCKKLDGASAVKDPNTVSIGNMHDLDANYVALINASSTNFDKQAEQALYAKAVSRLKEINEELWKQQVYGENAGVLSQYGYVSGLKKLTKLYIDEGSDTKGDYYIVKVDVYYENVVQKHSEADKEDQNEVSESGKKDETTEGVQINSEGNDSLTYNVYSQKFYKKDLASDPKKAVCPDIYLEYQPFVTDVSSESVAYAENEYILVDNYVDGVKVYLYKPKYEEAYAKLVGVPDDATIKEDDKIELSKYNFYKVNNQAEDFTDSDVKYNSYKAKKNVKIHICNTHMDTDKKKLEIFTNLDITTDVADGADNPQFVIGSTYDVFKDAAKTEGSAADGRVNFAESNLDFILPLEKDISTVDRLYTITVTLTPDDDYYNTIVLTGAKGEN